MNELLLPISILQSGDTCFTESGPRALFVPLQVPHPSSKNICLLSSPTSHHTLCQTPHPRSSCCSSIGVNSSISDRSITYSNKLTSLSSASALTFQHICCVHTPQSPPPRFSHSSINPPRGFHYPGHLPGQSHYPLDLWGPACRLPRHTGPLSFRHRGFAVGRLCTLQARHHGTLRAGGFIRTTCLCGSSISPRSFLSWGGRRKSFRLFPFDLAEVWECVRVFYSSIHVWVCKSAYVSLNI